MIHCLCFSNENSPIFSDEYFICCQLQLSEKKDSESAKKLEICEVFNQSLCKELVYLG